MILRLSQKLAKKLHALPLEARPLHEDPLADWSAHVFLAGRTQMVLFVNTVSLYPCIFPGRGLTDPRAFVTHAIDEVRDVVRSDEMNYRRECEVTPAIDEITVAKPLDRSVIGSMKDQIRIAKYQFACNDPIPRIVQQLTNMPLSALKDSAGRSHCSPKRVLKRLLEQRATPSPEV